MRGPPVVVVADDGGLVMLVDEVEVDVLDEEPPVVVVPLELSFLPPPPHPDRTRTATSGQVTTSLLPQVEDRMAGSVPAGVHTGPARSPGQ